MSGHIRKILTTEEEGKEVAQSFSEQWNFHHCCGSIDGKDVRIQALPKSGSVYYNYKSFYSIIMLALVDANYKIMYAEAGANGAASDAGVFPYCGLYHALEQSKSHLPPSEPLPADDTDVPYFLVGNDAFAIQSWMMKPHSKREMTAAEHIFNYKLSRACRIVENSFGILANRFRCLHSCMMQRPQTVTKTILAACVLHNLLAYKNPDRMQKATDKEDPATHKLDQENGGSKIKKTSEVQKRPGSTVTKDGKKNSRQNRMVGLPGNDKQV